MKDEQLVISVKEFRKIAGKEAANLSDAQIAKLIMDLDFMAKIYVDSLKEMENEQHGDR